MVQPKIFKLTEADQTKTHVLYFSHPDMNTIVRNYHPAMLSTSYDVILEKPTPVSCGFTMGIPITTQFFPMFDLAFKKNEISLNKSFQDSLSNYANIMRNYPQVIVKIIAYADNENEKTIAKKRQAAVRKYLSYHEGISDERMILVIEPKTEGARNLIIILPQDL